MGLKISAGRVKDMESSTPDGQMHAKPPKTEVVRRKTVTSASELLCDEKAGQLTNDSSRHRLTRRQTIRRLRP